MHPQSFVNDAVEMLRVLHHPDVEGLVRSHERVDFLAQFSNMCGVSGEVVEDVGQDDGDGVTARDDEQSGVSVQPFGGFDVVPVLSGLQEPRGDVGHCGLDVPALIDLLVAPADESPETASHERSDRTHGYQPRDRGEIAKEQHGPLQPVDGVVISPSLEHVEALRKGEIAHDVKGPVVEPCRRVHRVAGEGRNFLDQLVGVVCDTTLVVS